MTPKAVFRMAPAEGVDFCTLMGGDLLELADRFRARQAPTIDDVRLRVNSKEGQKRLRPCDAPWFEGDVWAFRGRALEGRVGEILRAEGSFVPLARSRDPIWLYHCRTVLDAIDLERSELSRLPSGNVSHIRKHIFLADMIGEHHVFRTNVLRAQYLTDVFVDAWTADKLSGIVFKNLAAL